MPDDRRSPSLTRVNGGPFRANAAGYRGAELMPSDSSRICAIVPVWQEADRLPQLLGALQREVDEVVVSDAGSPDGSAQVARSLGAVVVHSEQKGRGPQLNAGARATTAEVLVFVHADTTLPVGFAEAIRNALRDPGVTGGSFALDFEPVTRMSKVFTRIYHLQRVLLGRYYGDSCIFVRRTAFTAIGGFADEPIMEDYIFARALQRFGKTHYVRDVVVLTSSRRFARTPLRTLALWIGIQAGFEIGISPKRLARLYADLR